MSSPVLSIITPVYNAERTICRCIDSILSQSYIDFELLVIDDGSTDSSASLCDGYSTKDSRVHVFHTKNHGVSSARNIGLENAKGQWITFCDADDFVYHGWLANFAKFFDDPCDMICQGFDCVKPVFDYGDRPQMIAGRYTYGINGVGNVADILPSLLSSQTLHFLWIKAFRQQLIMECGLRFDTTLSDGEDFIFICQYLTKCNSIKSTNLIGYHYFVPDWSRKYGQSFDKAIRIGEQTYNAVRIIYKNYPDHELVRFYREDLTSKYINEFKSNANNRKYCLKQLREMLKNDFKHSQLYLPTKLAIRIDSTFTLSKFILLAHLYLK